MIGTVEAPALSASPLTVTEGRFNLFITDPDHVEARNMKYRMKMTSVEGVTITWRVQGHPRRAGLRHVARHLDPYITVYAATSRARTSSARASCLAPSESAEAAHHDARAERHRRRGAPGDGGAFEDTSPGRCGTSTGGIAAGCDGLDPRPRRARSRPLRAPAPRSIR